MTLTPPHLSECCSCQPHATTATGGAAQWSDLTSSRTRISCWLPQILAAGPSSTGSNRRALADPWSILQSQYASEDHSTDGSSTRLQNTHITAAAAATGRAFRHMGQNKNSLKQRPLAMRRLLQAVLAGGTLVKPLCSSTDRSWCWTQKRMTRTHPVALMTRVKGLKGARAGQPWQWKRAGQIWQLLQRRSGLSSSSSHSVHGAHHPATVAATKRPGGWGGGALATAGTLMLGDEPSTGYSTRGAEPPHDQRSTQQQ